MLKSERVNFLTHGVGALVWLGGAVFLGVFTRDRSDLLCVSLIYGLSALFMFGASAVYHAFKKEENERSLWRSLDHTAIFIMIAGSYTPVIWIWFLEPAKTITLLVQWSVALSGLILTFTWKGRPRWIDVVLYLVMGWVAVSVIGFLWELMSPLTFWLMLAGGGFYSLGAAIYALKKPNPWPGLFGFHEIFHLFILAGAGVHFWMIFESLRHALG